MLLFSSRGANRNFREASQMKRGTIPTDLSPDMLRSGVFR
jgi:hypothetical protein